MNIEDTLMENDEMTNSEKKKGEKKRGDEYLEKNRKRLIRDEQNGYQRECSEKQQTNTPQTQIREPLRRPYNRKSTSDLNLSANNQEIRQKILQDLERIIDNTHTLTTQNSLGLKVNHRVSTLSGV